jgi:hypothetical protein
MNFLKIKEKSVIPTYNIILTPKSHKTSELTYGEK